MEERNMICITCPAGCHITLKAENGEIKEVTGNSCPRGKAYAESEYLAPKRSLTSTVKAEGYTCPIISVRSKEPLPKEKMFDAMEIIRNVVAEPPFYVGKVVVENILDTGVDIIMSNR